ncbi:MAG: hypothetical protein AB1478_01695 [Nitrospirota bacterium]
MSEKKATKSINIEIVEAIPSNPEVKVEPEVEPEVENVVTTIDPVSGLSVAEKIAYYRAEMDSNAEKQIAEIRERI